MNELKKHKAGVILNYLSIIFILVIFYLIKLLGINKINLLFEIIPIVVLIVTFKSAFLTTNFWKMTHTSSKNLDERELQVVYKATTFSYTIFTIACLIIIYTFNLIGLGSIDVVLAACLLYFAHTLPAAIIAFTHK
ncbi:MAG: hypothetical protein HQ534_05585 [Armatimonadetes bacterium]|nr:hypothetical protein [Armatimonadota bacterium]